jgi:hypothetical protein
VATAFSSVTGQTISYVSSDPGSFRAQLEIEHSASAGDIANIYEEVRSGTAKIVTNDVERITGNSARSIEQYAEANKQEIEAAIESASRV